MPEVKKLGTLDPTHLDTLQQRVLKHYLKEASRLDNTFKKNELLTVQIDNITYQFELSHTIAVRQRASNPLQQRYEILTNVRKPLGKGGFGEYKLVVGTLAPGIGGRLIFKEKNRGVKEQEHAPDDNPAKNLDHEIAFTQKIPYMSVKTPIKKAVPFSPDVSSLTVMKNLPGKDLVEVLKTETLTVDEKINLSIQLIRQLQEYFHDQGIVHRDLKPHNIKYDRATQQVYIFDLGLAEEENTKNKSGGTPKYMPLEQFQGKPVSKSADIYTLGKILSEIWEMPHTALLIKTKGSPGLVELIDLSKKDVTFTMDKFNNIKDDNLNKSLIVSTIKGMTKADETKRMDLLKDLFAFEGVRLERELKAQNITEKHPDYAEIKYAHNLGLKTWTELREFDKQKDLRPSAYINHILNNLKSISDNKIAVTAYVNTLGINAFKGLDTKGSIIEKMKSMQEETQQNFAKVETRKKALNTILNKLEGHEKSKFYKLIKDILHDIDRLAEKTNKLSGNVDDLVILNEKIADTLNKVNNKIIQVDTIYHKGNIHRHYNLSNVVLELMKPVGANKSLTDLQTQIKNSIILYLAANYTKDAAQQGKRASSERRLKDMYELLYIVNQNNKDPQTIVGELKNRVKFIEGGTGAYFFQSGSELSDKVSDALKSYEQSHPARVVSRPVKK